MAITAKTPVKFTLSGLLASEKEMVWGVVDVTGTSTVQTNLQSIDILLTDISEDIALTAYNCSGEVTSDSTDPGEIVLKAWKPTGTGDVTPLAGTTAVLISFLAIGNGVNS